jgi:hypothetical protein
VKELPSFGKTMLLSLSKLYGNNNSLLKVILVLGAVSEAIVADLWMPKSILKGHKGAKLLQWKRLDVNSDRLFSIP